MSNETNTETNKPVEAKELAEKELEGVVGGARKDLERQEVWMKADKIQVAVPCEALHAVGS